MKNTCCNPKQIDRFLQGDLANQEEEALTRHLDVCEACRVNMEQSAADPIGWANIKAMLEKPLACMEVEGSPDATLPSQVRQVLGMLNPTDDAHSLGRLDDFEIRGIVGYGAMGVVLKAEDRFLDRVVAIKVMNPTLASCGTARLRFAREAKAAAGILHPNVIPIHSVSPNHLLPYLVMPYIKGRSLQRRISQSGPLSVQEILRVSVQIAAGLAAAHRQGLIHRDIKPANIMMEEGAETILITDFGLARAIDDATMTRSGTIAGTPEFMSPEQARGENIDFSSDLFSLGSVMYMLCTGRSPFRAQSSYGVLRKINDDQPIPIREINPDIPTWLCDIIARLHSKSSAARLTAQETFALLERCLAHVYQPDRILLPPEFSKSVTHPFPVFFPKPLKALLVMIVCTTICFVVYSLTSSALWGPLESLALETPPTNQTKANGSNVDSESNLRVFKRVELQYPNKDKHGAVVIDINRGFVEVSGHDDQTVVIEVLCPPETAMKMPDGGSLKFAPQYDLRLDEKDNAIRLDTYNQNYPLNLRVKVPKQTDLSLHTYYDGFLQVKNVEGHIAAQSQNCEIRLLEISGTATASNYNGNITVKMLSVWDNANLDFESYNGAIEVSLPPSLKATTAVSTGRGTYQSDFIIDSADSLRSTFNSIDPKSANSYQFGLINLGGVPLRIASEKGLVSIRKNVP